MTQPRDDKGRFTSDDDPAPSTAGQESGSTGVARVGRVLGAIGGILLAITAVLQFGLSEGLAAIAIVVLAVIGWVIGDDSED